MQIFKKILPFSIALVVLWSACTPENTCGEDVAWSDTVLKLDSVKQFLPFKDKNAADPDTSYWVFKTITGDSFTVKGVRDTGAITKQIDSVLCGDKNSLTGRSVAYHKSEDLQSIWRGKIDSLKAISISVRMIAVMTDKTNRTFADQLSVQFFTATSFSSFDALIQKDKPIPTALQFANANFVADTILGGNRYQNVYFSKEKAANTGKIFIAKNKGVVAIEAEGKLWTLSSVYYQ